MKPLKDQIFKQMEDVVIYITEIFLTIPRNGDGRLADRQ